MEMFEYLVNGIKEDRWHDIIDMSAHARLLLERIKTILPTGNMPSLGLPKWNVGLLYNFMSDEINDVDTLLDIVKELTDKAIFKVVFSSNGNYGYYEDVKNLARDIFRREGLSDVAMKKNVWIILILPEDTNYIQKTP